MGSLCPSSLGSPLIREGFGGGKRQLLPMKRAFVPFFRAIAPVGGLPASGTDKFTI
jgi:hypothetical protein